MSIQPLHLAAGYREALVVSSEPRLVHDGPEIVLADLSLQPHEALSRDSGINCDIAVDRVNDRIYFSDGPVRCWDRRSGEDRVVMKPPDFVTGPEAFAEPEDHLASKSFKYAPVSVQPCFVWLLALAPDASELVALAYGPDRQAKLVRMLLDFGTTTTFDLDGFSAGMVVDFRTRRLIQPAFAEGPRVLDLDSGEVVARLPGKLPGSTGRFVPGGVYGADSHPFTDEVVLGGTVGIVLWSLSENRWKLIDEHGTRPAWSSDGERIFYVRGESEVWVREGSGTLVRLLALGGGGELRAPEHVSGSFASTPVPSPCGRYLYAQLAREGAGDDFRKGGLTPSLNPFLACIVDLEERAVQAVTGIHHHNVAWI